MCDCCQMAVRTAYDELRAKGVDEDWAFEAAVKVYKYHHPRVQITGACAAVWDSLSSR